MSRHPTQPESQAPQSQPFLIAFFPWLCLTVSFIFVVTLHRKIILESYRHLWVYYLRNRFTTKMEGSDIGLTQRTRGRYMRIDDRDDNTNGNLGASISDINNSYNGYGYSAISPTPGTNLLTPNPCAKPNEYNNESTTPNGAKNQDPKSNNNNNNDILSLAKYFNHRTALLHEYVLEPPSPSPRPPQVISEQDWESEEEKHTRLYTGGLVIPVGHTDAAVNAAPDATAGWVHNLVEVAVRGFQSLHASEAN
ncbi:hypothetical protein BDW62DRAFT_201288 [Aspergillus aurantiobrunneus]